MGMTKNEAEDTNEARAFNKKKRKPLSRSGTGRKNNAGASNEEEES